MFGAGGKFFGSATPKSGTGTVTGANNGATDVANIVQLGQVAGTIGNPGKLLHDTEIPFNSFELLFSGIGAVAGKHFILRYAAGAPANLEPFIEFQDSAGVKMAEILFDDSHGDVSMVIGGINAIPGNRAIYSIGFDNLTNPGTLRDSILFGTHILTGAPASSQEKLLIIGFDSYDLGGAYGSYVVVVGHDDFDGMGADSIGNFIIGIGHFINNAAYPGGGVGDNVTVVGHNIGVGGAATDVIIFGNGFVTSLSHIALIGTPTQNVIVGGALVGETDKGAKFQARGNILGAGRRKAHRKITASDTFTKNDDNLLVDTTAGNIVVTIDPTIDGIEGTIKKVDATANTITVTPASGTIQALGAPTPTYVFNAQGQAVTFFSDGVNLYLK